MEFIPILSLVLALLLVPSVVIWFDERKQAKKCSLIVPNERRSLWPLAVPLVGIGLLLLSVLAFLGGCSSDPEQASASGASSEKITFPSFPNVFPSTTTTSTTTTTQTTNRTETCSYAGRYNGDRAQWYCSKKMSAYPKKLTVIVSGCYNVTISNNGSRYEKNGLIVKQSDVSGRGMAIVAQSSCKSKSAYIRY